MNRRPLFFFLICFLFLLLVAKSTPAQLPETAPAFQSPEVHLDKSVTFRFRDSNAKDVILNIEEKRFPMQKNGQGVWTIMTAPLDPDFYEYTFVVNGVSLIDPSNTVIDPNLLDLSSVVHVPGPASLPWEINNVPHGTVHHHFYRSAVVGDDRDFYVYTPPGYDPAGNRRYPVLYLLHGFSDDASAWTSVGHANVILDNLIAQHKAKPMIVVMPLGYGTPEIVTHSEPPASQPDPNQRNREKFRDALFSEVIPQVEKTYHVSAERNSRAVAGLSMGGAESLYVGLNATDRFTWIGSFSAGEFRGDFSAAFPKLDEKLNSQLHLLWIACGTEDALIEPNRKLREWLKSKAIHVTDIETPGAHAWPVWRRNLANFATLLFQ